MHATPFNYSDFLSRLAADSEDMISTTRLQTATLTYDHRKFPFDYKGHKTSLRDAYITDYLVAIEGRRTEILQALADTPYNGASLLDAVRADDDKAKGRITAAVADKRALRGAAPSLFRNKKGNQDYFGQIDSSILKKAEAARELVKIGGVYQIALSTDERDDIAELILNMVETTSKAWVVGQRRQRDLASQARGTGDFARAEIKLDLAEVKEAAKRAKAIVDAQKDLARMDVAIARAEREEEKRKLNAEKKRYKEELKEEAGAAGIPLSQLENYRYVVDILFEREDSGHIVGFVIDQVYSKLTGGEFDDVIRKQDFVKLVIGIIAEEYPEITSRLTAQILNAVIPVDALEPVRKDVNQRIKESSRLESVITLGDGGVENI